VRPLGADQVVDYGREDFTALAGGYDVIFDLIGNHSLTALRRSLTPGGTLVLSSGTGGRVLGPLGRILGALLLSPFVGQNLRIVAPTRGAASLDARCATSSNPAQSARPSTASIRLPRPRRPCGTSSRSTRGERSSSPC